MEAFVDGMLVKSAQASDHIKDLEEAFVALRRHKMKLNPTKRIFARTSGKFFGFLVTTRELKLILRK